MQILSNDERLAMLLNLVGEPAAEVAMKSVAPTRIPAIRSLINNYQADPPTQEEVDFVLNDFERYFQFAMAQIQKDEEARQKAELARIQADSPLAPKITYFDNVESTGNPAFDLGRLDPYQVATALQDDQPKTIALVLRQLEPEAAGKALDFFPEEVRLQTFLQMGQPITVPDPIVQKVLKATFDRANKIRERRVDPELIDKLVEMVRALPKETRRSMMTSLKESSAEMAEQIQVKLYRFEDLLRLDDRSIQAVLAKVQSEQLVMALTRADEKISGRLLGNMSKRARQSIEEEIGFNERATDEEIEAARFDIAQTLAKMDESGEVSL
ncbi:MAG: FliG C-terminal domain-containing protein [Pirellulaceae bacterium]